MAESDLPVIAQVTVGDDGKTLRGEDPATVAAVLATLDVAAVGVNCTVGPAVLAELQGLYGPFSFSENSATPGTACPASRE